MSAGEPAKLGTEEAPADALSRLSRAERARLLLIARYFSPRAQMAADDLLQEAMFRVLTGDRKLRPDLDLVRFLAGTIKSIASGEVQKRKVRAEVGFAETPMDLGFFADTISSGDLSPEDALIERQSSNAYNAAFYNWLEAEFDDDETTLMVLYAMFEGLKGVALSEATGVSTDQLATIRRRIRRKMNEYKSRGAT